MCGSSRYECIDGFAEELDEIVYTGMSNWFISFRSVFDIYNAHFSYFVVFFATITCGLLSLRHSMDNGKKFTQFWYGAFIHGVLCERGITASKYWHAQAPVMFFSKQLPLHIMFLYPSIYYVSMMAVQRLTINVCTQPAAVGLIAMLMEIPYRMISIKFLHITYHDSDPMFYNKLCGVPWVEIFSSLVLASSYVAVYHGSQFYISRNMSGIWDKNPPTGKEAAAAFLCGFTSPIVGFLQKILLLHVLHDFFNVNVVSCLILVVSLYLSFVICFQPKKMQSITVEDSSCKSFLFYQVSIYLFCSIYLAFFGRPENEISIGVHEPTGDCTQLVCSRTPLGMPLRRKKFLCADEVAARKNFVYNFDCLEEGPPSYSAIWYTICGSPIYNRPQFFLNLMTFIILLCTVFHETLFGDSTILDLIKGPKFRRGSPEIGEVREELQEEDGPAPETSA